MGTPIVSVANFKPFSFIEIFDQKPEMMSVDGTAFAKVQLEASLQYLLEFKAANANMNEQDFELYNSMS